MLDNTIPSELRLDLYISARYLQELETALRFLGAHTRYERPGIRGIIVPRLYVMNAEHKDADQAICVMVWMSRNHFERAGPRHVTHHRHDRKASLFMFANGSDHHAADADELGLDDAHLHLSRVRAALADLAGSAGLTFGEILLPSMPAETRRHAAGLALVALLNSLDPPHEDGQGSRSKTADWPLADMPFLVCTLEHPHTGVRLALLGAAVTVT